MTEPQTGTRARLRRLDGEAGPAAPIDAAHADALVAGAIAAWLGAPSIPPPVPPPIAGSTLAGSTLAGSALGGSMRAWPAVAVGGVLLAGAAWWLLSDVSSPTTPSRAVTDPTATSRSRLEQPTNREASGLVADGAPPLAHGLAGGGARAADSSNDGPVTAPNVAAKRVSAPAPEDLLKQANALRASGRYEDAARVYDRASRLAGDSLQAYVADVAGASLRLQHLGDPSGAVGRYQRALTAAPEGPLDLEALRGLASAFRRLGQPEREAEALRTLLARHPRGAAADEARQRLGALR